VPALAILEADPGDTLAAALASFGRTFARSAASTGLISARA
jgi:hypothetical protein